VSKESRRAARLARESRRLGDPARQPAAGAGAPDASDGTVGGGPSRPTPRPSTPAARAGRRERVRPGPQAGFLERYRSILVTVAAIAIAAVAAGYVFIGSTAATFTCGSQFSPSATPTLSPGSSTRLGFIEDDMGNTHILSVPVNYLYCPPASGNHFGNNPGVTGPIPARVYKPDDKVGPPNWIHNLEHGGMVVLYRNDSPGSTGAGQQAFRDYFDSFPDSPVCKVPKGVLSPVIARFDDMPHPYAALVWDRVFYLDTWDPALVNQFYLTESERVDANGELVAPPEKVACQPTPYPSAGTSAEPSGSAGASDAPSVVPSAAPTASPEPSAAPS
jgi:hypothetical protein